MDRASVPTFGNWENEDNVPYTVYFEKARKNKGGKMINPNDPQENPDMFPDPPPLAPAKPRSQPPGESNGRGAVGATKEDGDIHQSAVNESSSGGGRGRAGRTARRSAGSEQSFERSPLHQAKVTGRGSGSPAWEGKSHGSTPGRSKLKPTSRGDESPEEGAAVPRFGEWDENNPQSAENFTHIFNKVREERNTGAANVSGTPRHQSYVTQQEQPKRCCCGWW